MLSFLFVFGSASAPSILRVIFLVPLFTEAFYSQYPPFLLIIFNDFLVYIILVVLFAFKKIMIPTFLILFLFWLKCITKRKIMEEGVYIAYNSKLQPISEEKMYQELKAATHITFWARFSNFLICDPLIQFLLLWWELPSHNYKYTTVMNHNGNIWYTEYLVCDPPKGLWPAGLV